MEIFRTLGKGSLSVTSLLDLSGKSNTSIHGRGEDDTAMTLHDALLVRKIHKSDVGSMLGLRRRQWANIKPTLVQCLVFAGTVLYGW